MWEELVNADITTMAAADKGNAVTLRATTAALAVVSGLSFVLVGALAPAVLSIVIGGTVAFFVRASRTVVVVLAGLLGLGIALLAANYLAASGAPGEIGDQVFVYGGGLLGLATVVLAGMTVAGARTK
jgi:hypothetical protein